MGQAQRKELYQVVIKTIARNLLNNMDAMVLMTESLQAGLPNLKDETLVKHYIVSELRSVANKINEQVLSDIVQKENSFFVSTSTKHNSMCLQKAADDEPVFVLRAKDPTVLKLILEWIEANRNIQPKEKIDSAFNIIHEIAKWRSKNIDK